MKDQDLIRYSRQIMLPEIDAGGQLKLANAKVVIFGLGGLGSSASIYLAAAGVGHMVLIDFDTVDLSNLQRQILHSTNDIGKPKTESAKEHLLSLNPDVKLTLVERKLGGVEINEIIKNVDVVIDATDNFTSRFMINEACVKSKIPLVSGAAIRFEAQVCVFDSRDDTSPCYRCLYGEGENTDETCTANGVISPLLGIIGSIQAIETMKLIMGIGETLKGKLLLFDAMSMDWHQATLSRDPGCTVCGPH
jgi:molybdopterin/thiamine biosynthesis adenylyltransferase